MMHRQRLNPVRQQQQQMGRNHEVTLSPKTPQSPQTVRRKTPCIRPEQMTTTVPAPAPAPAPAVAATRCLSQGRAKGAANQAGDLGTRIGKPNVGRRGGVSNQPMQAEQQQQQQQQQPLARNHHYMLPRVARLANNNHTNISNNKEVAGGKNVAVPPTVCPPLNLGTRERLPAKSPYLPSGSEIQISSMPDQTSSTSSSSGRHGHRIKLANAIRLPDQQNKSFVYLCKPVKKVKELLTARQLRQSNEHLEAAFEADGGMMDDNPIDIDNVINNSSDLSSTSTSSPYNSLEILQKRQLEVEEHFSKLPGKSYQQMLETQLRQVRQQETQLQRLANCANNQQDDSKDENNEDENENENVAHRKNEKLEKLVCQNIPTLQNEIKLLQQLGEQLVATLRVSKVCPADDNRHVEQPKQLSSLSDDNNDSYNMDLYNDNSLASQSSSVYYTPRSLLPGELVIRKIYCLRVERVPTICERATVKAAFHYIGVVKEFRIEMKTLNEIKTGDDTQCFYMPSHGTISPEGGTAVNLNRSDIDRKAETAETAATIILAKANELRSTSFRKLRENPNVLIQQLRPKSTMRPLNLLEQDTALFINSLAHGDPYKLSSSTSIPSEHRETGGAAAFDPTTRFQSAHDRLTVSSQTFSSNQLQTVTTQTDKLKPKLKTSSSSLSIGHRSRRLLKRKSKTHLSDEQAKILRNILQTTPVPTPTSISAVDSGVLQTLPKNRRRRRRQVAPCGRRDLEPKVHLQLLKTVSVGIVQIAVFLVLIMAFTYPDIRC
ncbi:uncharacterized protein [Drosophila tropicalis]|uniref:uncharacterized protein n=1 Tax=Drosophila tropicalis TaxID=46794 RepID=UPI0035ABED62